MHGQKSKRTLLRWVIVLMALPVPALVYATVTLPYTPQSGQVISAAGLKSNFDALNAGKTDSSKIHQITSAGVASPAQGADATASAQCPANSMVIGGGCATDAEGWLTPRRERPDYPTQSFVCTYVNGSTNVGATIYAYAICVDQ
jgi:hypothetical protein